MSTYKDIEVELKAGEVMALVPILDKEIAYQKTYAGTCKVEGELQAIRDKIAARTEINIPVSFGIK